MIKTFLILCLLSTSSLRASEVSSGSSNHKGVDKVNLHTFNIVDRVTFQNKNEHEKFSYFFGIQREEYQKKNGIFVRDLSPNLAINRDLYLNEYMKLYIKGFISKSIIGTKEGLKIGLFKRNMFQPYLTLELGEKININDQKNSGFFFTNIGLNLKIKFNKVSFILSAYKPIPALGEIGFSIQSLFSLQNKNRFGFYFSLDQYNSSKDIIKRDGQSNLGLGFILQF